MKPDPTHRGMIIAALSVAVWALLSPWVIADAGVSPALWNFHLAGLLAVIFSVAALIRSDDWAAYGLMAIGAWLVVSPWVLGLDSLVTRQTVFYGLAIATFAWAGRPSCVPKAQA